MSSLRSRQGGGALDPRWRVSSAEPTSAMAANCSLCEGTRQTYCINRRLQESYELLHRMRCECRRVSKAELRRICQVQRRRGGAHSGATRACPQSIVRGIAAPADAQERYRHRGPVHALRIPAKARKAGVRLGAFAQVLWDGVSLLRSGRLRKPRHLVAVQPVCSLIGAWHLALVFWLPSHDRR